MRNNRGFTLVELVVVIVILGVLAAVAIPRFADIKDEAQVAALSAVVGSLKSASSINHMTWLATSGKKGTALAGMSCQDAAAALLQGGVPEGYKLDGDIPKDGEGECTVYAGTEQKSVLLMSTR